jgi:hypothetical protein
MNLTAGVEYYILADNEFIDTETQTFEISCPCTYTSLGGTPESESCGADLNGGCNATPEAYEPILCGETISGTLWADGGNRDTDWYQLTVTEATTIEVDYSGGMPINAVLIDNCTDFNILEEATSLACGSGGFSYPVTPGTYILAIVPTAFEAYPCGTGTENDYDVTVTYCNPPVNDLCSAAVPVTCGSTTSGTTVNSTADDAPFGTQYVSEGVWYVLAGTGDEVTASTCDAADFDTEIVIATGSCGNLTYLANNDDDFTNCTGNTSQVTFDTEVGTDYYIYVGDYFGSDVGPGGNEGTFDLTITCTPPPPAPANDDVCNAAPLVLGSNTGFTNVGATVETGEPLPAPTGCQEQDGWCDLESGLDNTTWFTFEGPSSGNLVIDTDGSDDDTQIAVYSATSCQDFATGSAVQIAANDDNPDYITTIFSSIVFLCDLTPGETYYLQVDGYDGAEGAVVVNLTETTVDADYTSSATGLVVDFTDASAASTSIVSWAWDFGDGNTSTDEDPSHTYAADGTYTVCLTVTDENGCTSEFCTDVTVADIPTSIAEAVDRSMHVYPNPSNGEFVVEINGVDAAVQLNVLDLSGRMVYTEGAVLNGNFRKDLNLDMAAGTYLLQIATEEGLVTRKIQIH